MKKIVAMLLVIGMALGGWTAFGEEVKAAERYVHSGKFSINVGNPATSLRTDNDSMDFMNVVTSTISDYAGTVSMGTINSAYIQKGWITFEGGMTAGHLLGNLRYGQLVLNNVIQFNYSKMSEGWPYGSSFTIKKGAPFYYKNKAGEIAYVTLDADYKFTINPNSAIEGKTHHTFKIEKNTTQDVVAQMTKGTTLGSESTDLRIITHVDSLDYQSVGFDVVIEGEESSYTTKTVYESLQGVTKGTKQTYYPEDLFEEAAYFATVSIKNLPNEDFDKAVSVTPKWTKKDGETVYGVPRVICVQDHVEQEAPAVTGDIVLANPDNKTDLSYTIEQPCAAGSTISFDVETSTVKPLAVWILGDSSWTKEYFANGFVNRNGKMTITDTIDHAVSNVMIYIQYRNNNYEKDTESDKTGYITTISNVKINGIPLFGEEEPEEPDEDDIVLTNPENTHTLMYTWPEEIKAGSQVSFDVETNYDKFVAVFIISQKAGNTEYFGKEYAPGAKISVSDVIQNDEKNLWIWVQFRSKSNEKDMTSDKTKVKAYIKNLSYTLPGGAIEIKNKDNKSDLYYDVAQAANAGSTITFDIETTTTKPLAVWVLGDGSWDKIYYESGYVNQDGKATISTTITDNVSMVRIYFQYRNDAHEQDISGDKTGYITTISKIDIKGAISVPGTTGKSFVTYDVENIITAGNEISFELGIAPVQDATVSVVNAENPDEVFFTQSYEAWDEMKTIKAPATNHTRKVTLRVNFDDDTKDWGMNTVLFRGIKVTDQALLLPTYFGDGMLFQQNKPMNIWGFAPEGEEVTAKLYKGSTLVETKEVQTNAEGRWDIAFSAQKGSYDKYSIDLSVGDVVFERIEDVLVGELWMACGQSNMFWQVNLDMDAEEMLANATNEYIRFYLELNNVSMTLSEKGRSVAGAYWGFGNNPDDVKGFSSIAYNFAMKLEAELNVPVGILNTPVGGTGIQTWLSSEAIESDPELKELFVSKKLYHEGITSLYNARIAPLEGTNIAGIIWYQGENNVGSSEIYHLQLDLLKRSWGKVFGYEDGDVPFIFSQIAPYHYYTNLKVIGYLSMFMEKAWKMNEDNNMAMLTVYDLPLDHMRNGTSSDSIHPRIKEPVGERYFRSAMNLVYGGEEEYTAPVYKSMEIIGDEIYITFDRVGDGLKTTDGSKNLHGFTIAGDNGIYVGAEAVIVDKDTVKVWNIHVPEPKNATYAFDDFTQGSNLCNSSDIPASPFRTVEVDDRVLAQDPSIKYYISQDWMYADKDVWVYDSTNVANYYAGYRPSFTVSGGSYTYDSDTFYEGTASLKVTYNDDFEVSPILTYESILQDWSKFNYLSVYVKAEDATETSLVITNGTDEYVLEAAKGTKDLETGFELLTFDMTSVPDVVLKNISKMTFRVTAPQEGEMHFDNFFVG